MRARSPLPRGPGGLRRAHRRGPEALPDLARRGSRSGGATGRPTRMGQRRSAHHGCTFTRLRRKRSGFNSSPGEPLVLELELEAEKEVSAASGGGRAPRCGGVLLGRAVKDTGPLGGVDSRSLSLVFELDRLPLAEGSFTLSVAVTDSSGKHLFHGADDVAAFPVHADRDDVRGTVLLDGRWSAAGQPRLRRRASG